jgi:hypothetical protein
MHATCHASLILLDLITHLVKHSSYEAPQVLAACIANYPYELLRKMSMLEAYISLPSTFCAF